MSSWQCDSNDHTNKYNESTFPTQNLHISLETRYVGGALFIPFAHTAVPKCKEGEELMKMPLCFTQDPSFLKTRSDGKILDRRQSDLSLLNHFSCITSLLHDKSALKHCLATRNDVGRTIQSAFECTFKVNKYLFQQCFTQVKVIDNFFQLQQNYHPHTTEIIQRPTAPKSRQRTRRCFSRQDGSNSYKIELNDTRRKKNDSPTKTIHADVNILY